MSSGRQRLSIIPAMAVTDPRLEPRDLQVLCLLGRHTDDLGWCTRSQVKMAKELGCGRATVQRAIGRLVSAGYVEHRPKRRESGADAAHDYRVVLDPVEQVARPVKTDPAPADNPEGGVPIDGQGCPPMDGQGVPTHERAPMLTTPDKRCEREARASEREEGQPETEASGENRKAVERAFERAFREWPTSIGDSRPEAWKAWCELSPEERERAAAEAARYVEAARATGRNHLCSHAVYLREKRWEGLPPPEPARPAALDAPPFGPLWSAARMKQLVTGPKAALPELTAFQRRAVEQGLMDEAEIRREQQAKFGWPAINAMHERARDRKGVAVAQELEGLAALMEPVPVGSGTWEAWRREHERRGWPWLPDTGDMRVAYFPAGGPAGLAAFEAALEAGSGAMSEAAE